MRYRLLVLTVLGLLLLAACGRSTVTPDPTGTPTPAPATPRPAAGAVGYTNIAPAQLNAMLSQKDFTFVNVHTPYEGEIDRTDVFIPYDEIDKHLDRLTTDKGAKIVLYCRSGHMSAVAATTLAKLGYTQIKNLDGGMIAWERAGYPLTTKSP
jgi:rhodanese-related sulfurtransferase